MQKIKRLLASALAGLTSVALLASPVAAAGTVVVTPGNDQGWLFNPDPTTATPYEFNEDQASIGDGSLYVLPIDADPPDKFIAAKPLDGMPAADLTSISYDFLIAGDGVEADAAHFYLNVYTNLPESETFYDCRFDYVPTTGSLINFTTASFLATDTPTNVTGADCPATLAEMPADSTISFFSLNVGDTSVNDEGLAGYLDNVVVTHANDTTTYDLELNEPEPEMPTSKDECKKGGWQTFEVFKNQGDCVSWVATNGLNPATGLANF